MNSGSEHSECHAYLDVPDAAHVHPRLGLVGVQGHRSFIALSKEGKLHVRALEAPEVLQTCADPVHTESMVGDSHRQVANPVCYTFRADSFEVGPPA